MQSKSWSRKHNNWKPKSFPGAEKRRNMMKILLLILLSLFRKDINILFRRSSRQKFQVSNK